MNTNLVQYYKDRAKEYEKIYFKPERQEELAKAQLILQDIFKNKQVVEVACGTGYWTEHIALSAKSVLATDINKEVIAIAQQKDYPNKNVVYQTADLYTYKSDKKHESLFAGFIWSHVKRQEIKRFVDTLNTLVMPGGTLVIMDNNFVKGSSTPITKTDELANTFQTRKLSDGSTHLVLKNFPTEAYLRETLHSISSDLKFIQLQYFWIAVISTKTK